MPDREDAAGGPASGELLGGIDPALGDLRERLDRLQQSVEQLGTEQATTEPAEQPADDHDDGAAAPPVALAVGPIPELVDLPPLEERIEGIDGVAGVRVRWFGRRWARIDVAVSGPTELGRAMRDLERPMDVEVEPNGLVVARFADVGDSSEPIPSGARLPAAVGPQGSVDRTVAKSLPEAVCRHFLMVPIASDGATLTLAIVNPADRLARDVAAALTGTAVAAVPTTGEAIEEAIDAAFGPADETEADRQATPDQRQQVADELGIPVIDLDGIAPTDEALEMLPRDLQSGIPCVPLAVDDEALFVAIAAPLGSEAAGRIGAYADGRLVRAFLAPPDELEALADELHEPAPGALRSPPPTAFPGRGGEANKRKRRWLLAVPLAVWSFLRAPVPVGVALILIGALVYLYLADQLP